jgi:hypothetical protein
MIEASLEESFPALAAERPVYRADDLALTLLASWEEQAACWFACALHLRTNPSDDDTAIDD